ncbi:MAG TPA: hypothetical protein VGJ66_18595 [Pyrinomonadaceae bacterium]|jgi:hypothetical protein
MSQTVLPDAIEFHQDKPFYDMVSAYITAVVGLESVFDPNNRMGFKLGETARLDGLAHPQIRVVPFQVYEMAMKGKIDIRHVVHSLAKMLVNTAYEAAKDKNDLTGVRVLSPYPECEFPSQYI